MFDAIMVSFNLCCLTCEIQPHPPYSLTTGESKVVRAGFGVPHWGRGRLVLGVGEC